MTVILCVSSPEFKRMAVHHQIVGVAIAVIYFYANRITHYKSNRVWGKLFDS